MLKTVTNQVPVANVVGLGTMATQNANSVAITGGSATGLTAVHQARGQVNAGASSTTTLFTLANSSTNQSYLVTVRQGGSQNNHVVGYVFAFGANSKSLRVAQDNTNVLLDMNIVSSGLNVQLVLASGFGLTTWDWVRTRLG
jgi:hypothetical protein